MPQQKTGTKQKLNDMSRGGNERKNRGSEKSVRNGGSKVDMMRIVSSNNNPLMLQLKGGSRS